MYVSFPTAIVVLLSSPALRLPGPAEPGLFEVQLITETWEVRRERGDLVADEARGEVSPFEGWSDRARRSAIGDERFCYETMCVFMQENSV